MDWAGAYDCGAARCPAGYDGLHPNARGEFQIARAFALTLHQRFGIGTHVPDLPASVPARPAPAVPGPVAESVPTGIKVTWRPVLGARGYTVRSRLVAVVTWNDVGGGLPGGARPVNIGAGTPPAPTDLTIRSVDPVSAHLNWKGSKEAAGYRVWVRDNYTGGGFSADEYISETTDRGITFLFPGNWNFDFCVTAVNGSLESGRSNCVALQKPPPTDPIEPPSTGKPKEAAELSPGLEKLMRLRAQSDPDATAALPTG